MTGFEVYAMKQKEGTIMEIQEVYGMEAQSVRTDYVDAARERRFFVKNHGLVQNRQTRKVRTRLAAKRKAIAMSLLH